MPCLMHFAAARDECCVELRECGDTLSVSTGLLSCQQVRVWLWSLPWGICMMEKQTSPLSPPWRALASLASQRLRANPLGPPCFLMLQMTNCKLFQFLAHVFALKPFQNAPPPNSPFSLFFFLSFQNQETADQKHPTSPAVGGQLLFFFSLC